ncbi:MAG TPA: metallophosphoesterase [Bryobacteraceae bacterium]|nr:metallophosphoesterase [Bryobacteraceae bacterium]
MTLRICAALLLAWSLRADAPFFFLQGTDPQFGMYEENRGFARETANFEKFIATANRLKPAFVIVTGDLVNRAGDPEQTKEYLRIAAKLDRSIPIHHVAGNHDFNATPASLAAYRKMFGPDWYTFRRGTTAFFVLNSVLMHSPGPLASEAAKQEAWFKDALAKAKQQGARRLIVFQHHPHFLLFPEEPEQYFNLPKGVRQRYLKILSDARVSHVFAGHYHLNMVASGDNLELVTTGPIGKPRGTETSGFRIVTVRDSGVEHAYHALDSAPARFAVQ